jgi:hypothetical protein
MQLSELETEKRTTPKTMLQEKVKETQNMHLL